MDERPEDAGQPGEAATRLRCLLRARGQPWPAPLEYREVVGSTNDLIKLRAREGGPAWSVALAGRQTAGRGRQGRAWFSPPGSLSLSVLLRPALSRDALGVLPLVVGLAVCEAVSESGVGAELKWPNDVLVCGRKLAGVLVEATSGAAGIDSVAVGVGVNVALFDQTVPPELTAHATSLAAEGVRAPDSLAVAAGVLTQLRVCYDALEREGAAGLMERWRRRSVAWWGRRIEVRFQGQVRRGVARGVDDRGALLLEESGGSLKPILSGEAREIRLSEP